MESGFDNVIHSGTERLYAEASCMADILQIPDYGRHCALGLVLVARI